MLNLLTKFLLSKSERATFLRFATVGSTIAFIDGAILYFLLGFFSVDPYVGRAISLFASMTAGYLLNRHFTFHHREHVRALWHALVRFYSVNAMGAAINIGVYSLVLEVGQWMGGEVAASATLPMLGVLGGGIAGMIFNFVVSNKLVFDGRS